MRARAPAKKDGPDHVVNGTHTSVLELESDGLSLSLMSDRIVPSPGGTAWRGGRGL